MASDEERLKLSLSVGSCRWKLTAHVIVCEFSRTPGRVERVEAVALELACCSVQPLDLVVREQGVLLQVPRFPKTEVPQNIRPNLCRNRCLYERREAFLRIGKMHCRIRYQQEPELSEFSEEQAIGIQVVRKASEGGVAGVNIRQGDHRGGRRP